MFIPADVGARLRPLVADMYGADGTKSLLNRLAPMVDEQMLQGWILDKGVAVGSGRVVSATAVERARKRPSRRGSSSTLPLSLKKCKREGMGGSCLQWVLASL